jgi:acyl dehydratase
MTDFMYFEDFVVGQTWESPGVTMEEAEMIAFAETFDPQPMHTDPVAAETTTGGLIASGWHTASLTMRMMIVGTGYKPAPGTLGLGFEHLKWLQPVRPGDTLRLRLEVMAVRASDTRPDRGIITNRIVTVNQRGEPVQEMVGSAIIPKRNSRGIAT